VSGFVSFKGPSTKIQSRNATPGLISDPNSEDHDKEFRLIEKAAPPNIDWFDVNLMETEDESFTLGFAVELGNFWIKNKVGHPKFIEINLDKFIKRGADIDEILGYLAHNLQYDIMQKLTAGLT
jgi:hypothetical protein